MTDGTTEILTPEQVVTLLQISPRTVEEWRRTHCGPPWRRMGRYVRYLRREVLVWFDRPRVDRHYSPGGGRARFAGLPGLPRC